MGLSRTWIVPRSSEDSSKHVPTKSYDRHCKATATACTGTRGLSCQTDNHLLTLHMTARSLLHWQILFPKIHLGISLIA